MKRRGPAALLAPVLAALALAFACVTPAWAIQNTDTGTITVSNVESGVDASAYQVIEVNYDFDADQPKDPEFTWAPSVRSWVSTNYATYIDTQTGAVTKAFSEASARDVKAFYDKLAAAIRGGNPSVQVAKTAQAQGTTVTLSDLPMGGYLVLVENGQYVYEAAAHNIVPEFDEDTQAWQIAEPTIDAEAKRESVDVTKTVEDVKVVGAQYGDLLDFTLEADVPGYPDNAIEKTYEIGDDLSAGLTLKAGTIKVYGIAGSAQPVELTSGTHYTLVDQSATMGDDAQTSVDFKVVFDYDALEAAGYDTVRVTYQASLNRNAPVGPTGNPNEVILGYANNPYENDSYTTKDDDVKVFSYGIDVLKYDGSTGGTTPLAGAEFKLCSDADGEHALSFVKAGDGVYRVPEEGETTGTTTTLVVGEAEPVKGQLVLNGLKEGTYYLIETKAPDGFNISTTPVTFTIVDKDDDGDYDGNIENQMADKPGYVHADFENKKGFLLPQTGGLGTVAFVVGGLALVGGGCVYTAKRVRGPKGE